jgi:hypothetical protein
MHNPPQLERALYGSQDAGGYRFLACSPGFTEEWQAEAERLCTGFGERPAGVACPRAIFARPFAGNYVAVVQAADQGQDDQGRPGALCFYLVVLPAYLYEFLGGDPFYLAERMPPPWPARGVLSPLSFTEPPPPPRTTTSVVELLKQPTSATLFGGAQALLDGGQVAFERPAPDEALVRGLWALLPYSSRQELWPASFAFGNALDFDAVVVPRLDPDQFPGYILEEHAGDYPEGQYELSLQRAAEAGNQEELDALFTRRSYRQTRRLALILLAVVFFLPLVAAMLKNPARPKREKPEPRRQEPPDGFSALKKASYPKLSAEERHELTLRLRELTTMMGTRVPANVPGSVAVLGLSAAPGAALNTSALLSLGANWLASAEELLDAIDIDPDLGTPDTDRKGREIRLLKPAELKLRALLFKHGVSDFDNFGKKTYELVDELQTKLRKEGRRKKHRER